MAMLPSAFFTGREFLVPASHPARVCSEQCPPSATPTAREFRSLRPILLEFADRGALTLQFLQEVSFRSLYLI